MTGNAVATAQQRVWFAVMACSLGAMACSSSSRPVPDTDTSPHLDAGSADTGRTTESGTAESGAGDGGSSDGSGVGNDGGEDDGAVPLPVCRQGVGWSTLARVTSIAANGFDRFGAISASQLTVAWTTSAGVIYVADRTSNTGAFGTPAALDPGAIQLANDRVALGPTGLLLIAPLADGSSFAAFVRSSIGAAWAPDPSTPSEFHTIASALAEPGGAFSEPVVSADGLSFFYLLALGSGLPELYESTWDAVMGQWAYGNPLPNAEFAITDASQVRRATGASSDRRTLFFFDEVSGNERAAWRDSPTSPFTQFADLPSLPEAAPGGDCVTLYFHGSDASGEGLFTGQGQ